MCQGRSWLYHCCKVWDYFTVGGPLLNMSPCVCLVLFHAATGFIHFISLLATTSNAGWWDLDVLEHLPNIMKGQEATVMTKGWSSNNKAPKPLRTARPVEKTPQDATHTFVLTLSNLKANRHQKDRYTQHALHDIPNKIFYQPPTWDDWKCDGNGVGGGE